MMTVKEIAEITGISARTLHYSMRRKSKKCSDHV